MRRALLAIALLLVGGGAIVSDGREAPPQVLTVPGRRERVVLDRGEVWLEREGRRRSLGLARYHPWKLAWAHVAGRPQLAVGVFKPTRFDPEPHHALFLYDWEDGELTPRWLGSRLSKPFSDFAFADMRRSGETELAAAEQLRDGRWCLVIYRWTGFGFQGEWQSRPFARLSNLTVSEPAVTGRIASPAGNRSVWFGWRGDSYGEIPPDRGRR